MGFSLPENPLSAVIAFAVLVLAWFAGSVAISAFSLPVPAPLIGMFLVFSGLVVMRKVPEGLDRVAQFLLRHLSVMFVPATLAVLLYVDKLKTHGLLLIASLVVTTAISLVITTLIARRALKDTQS